MLFLFVKNLNKNKKIVPLPWKKGIIKFFYISWKEKKIIK